MWPEIDLRQDRAFLTLAEELHFGRTAVRLGVTPARISQTIHALETRMGGRLFERTSRKVALTPLGARLDARLRPALDRLVAALDRAAMSVRSTAGTLRVGVTITTDTPAIHRVVDHFAARHPECDVEFVEIGVWDPYGPLRRGEIDLLCNWQAVEEPDLTVGPTIAEHPRVLVLSECHHLAEHDTVRLEDLAGEIVPGPPRDFPRALDEALYPPRTPSGRPIRRSPPVASYVQQINMVARGEIVAPTVTGIRAWSERPGVVQVPFSDLPPLPLGFIWSTAHEHERIRALAELVAGGDDVEPARPHGPTRRRADLTGVKGSELRALLTLADELHFARTAELLGLTPSRVSQLVRTLEARLGARLFDRTSRRVHLTPLGRQLVGRLRPPYQQIVDADARVPRPSATVTARTP